MACAPAPSCWLEENDKKGNSDYLRSICADYAKGHRTLTQLAQIPSDDSWEPEKVPAFGRACEKLGIHLRK
jgi:hypothetical protein